jgi:hypothetical protein
MSITKLFLGGNNDVIYKLFPPRESLVNDIPAGDGNIEKLFLQCDGPGSQTFRWVMSIELPVLQVTYDLLLCTVE